MKVRREIASLPVRSARETWRTITELITAPGSIDADQLDAAGSIIAAALADEHAANVPVVVRGVGSRLVIYTVHGADAMELGSVVDSLSWNPTGGDAWRVTVPCDGDDVAWMNASLKARAWRISVHDVRAPPSDDDAHEPRGGGELAINWAALEKR